MSILLTGSSGFIGTHILKGSMHREHIRTISLREKATDSLDLNGIEAIIHCAGLAHQSGKIPVEKYREINTSLTLSLAAKARDSGCRLFIFLSTIKAFGEEKLKRGVSESTVCQPDDGYGISKYEAEEELKALQTETFSVAIIRPPLVLGANVKGNLDSLMKLAKRSFPLPFGAIENNRPMIGVRNLVLLIDKLIKERQGGMFIPQEQAQISTTLLVSEIRKAMDFRSARLFAIPGAFRQVIRKMRPGIYDRLFGSILIDNQSTAEFMSDLPLIPFEESVREMVAAFKISKEE